MLREAPGQDFGKKVLALRKGARKSLRQVQREVGISPSYLASIEKGERKAPKRAFLLRLAQCYDVPPDGLLQAAGLSPMHEAGHAAAAHTLLSSAHRDDAEPSSLPPSLSENQSRELVLTLGEAYERVREVLWRTQMIVELSTPSPAVVGASAGSAGSLADARGHVMMNIERVLQLSRESSQRLLECIRCFQAASFRLTGRQLGGDPVPDLTPNDWLGIGMMVVGLDAKLNQVLERLSQPESSPQPISQEPAKQELDHTE